jgi:hypothetical protein
VLAYVTGLVNHRLLLRCEYLIVENRVLRTYVPGALRLSDSERCTLAEIGKRLGRELLYEVAVSPNRRPSWTEPSPDRRQIRRLHPPSISGSTSDYRRSRSAGNTDGARESNLGTMTALPVRSSILATSSRMKRSAMSCAATGWRRHPSAVKPPPGRNSSRRTWPFWRARLLYRICDSD